MRCKARRSLWFLFSAPVDFDPRRRSQLFPPPRPERRARGSAIDAARSGENWSLSIRTFAPASELHSPRGGSFVEGRQFPIFERPNSSYNRGTVPVPGAASGLYEGRLDGPLAGRVGVLPIFRIESAEV